MKQWIEYALTAIAALSLFALYAVRYPPFEHLIFHYYALPRTRGCIDGRMPRLLTFISYNDRFGEAFLPWTISWLGGLSLAVLIAWRFPRIRLPLLGAAALVGPAVAFLSFATWNANALGIGCTWWRDPPQISCISLDDPNPHPCVDPRQR